MQPTLKLFAAGAAALVMAACSPGSLPGASSPPEETAPAVVSAAAQDVEAVIGYLEREWVAAIVKKDATALDRLLADEFAGTSPSAHTYTKDMAIMDLTSGTYVVTSMAIDEIAVNTYGNVAVAFTSQEEMSSYNGVDLSGHYHYTDVWVNKDGRWQAVASHGSRYDKKHPLD